MGNPWDSIKEALTPSIQGQFKLRKLAGLFAGLNHMQPLLLATTNANYLLDRFCMERCCSGEYISRIVTSLIFMEIIATLLVACIGVYIACKYSSEWSTTTGLNNWNYNEEWYIGLWSSIYQLIIFLGYIQILYAFTTGGKKGHMHWFYVSLMFQQFVCLLIGGAIGFWEGGVTLWYLMAIPMGPIPVFFYQLMIHSWIRNNGPRYPEYLVVEYQILLALSISALATILWILAYLISHIPIELEITGLNPTTPTTSDGGRIDAQTGKAINVTLNTGSPPLTGQVTGNGLSGVTVNVNLSEYSLTLVAAPANLVTVTESATNKRFVTLALTGTATITLTATGGGKITGTRDTSKDIKLALNIQGTSPSNPELKVYSATANVQSNNTGNTATITLKSIKAEGTITVKSNETINTVEVTIPVKIEIKTEETASQPVHITSVKLKLPVPEGTDKKLNLDTPSVDSGTLNITVAAQPEAATEDGDPKATIVKVDGKGFYPTKSGFCFYSVRDTNKDIWANIGGKCEYVACYYKNSGKNPALLVLYFRSGGSPERKYFGTQEAGNTNTEWKIIKTEDDFIGHLKTLANNGSFTLSGQNTDQYNRDFKEVLGPFTNPSATWAPLVMHGMAVGSFGSIFPNLIPKTLVCARTSRTLTVVSIFLSPVPHIFNLALAEYGNNPASCAWTWKDWHLSYLLYLIYGLAFLFAIFNVHSPEWKLCCYIRSHGWMPFMMTLSITLIIEILIAIARAGIMTQRSANPSKLNHPLLWNKMACLMSLSYLPFWLTTTPMMKSYVSSLDPFLCDKDRDHWPTARYGKMKSFGYWCKCACRGLYTSPRKLITLNMRKALTRKDPPLFYTLYGVLLMITGLSSVL